MNENTTETNTLTHVIIFKKEVIEFNHMYQYPTTNMPLIQRDSAT
jgi:hypothetical protein